MNPTRSAHTTLPARNARRTLEGTVTSDRCTKTITVQVERTFKHPKYKKFVRKLARYHAHDEKSEAKRGDRVEIRSCRPLSRTKRWLLVRVVERATAVEPVDVTTGIAEGAAPDARSEPARTQSARAPSARAPSTRSGAEGTS